MKPKFSEKDSRGMLSIDCIECTKGFRGDKSCSSGARIKSGHKGSCFSGVLLPKYDEAKL